ncbi:MAG: hypothetical protein EBU54_15640, partial [Mycobacteriaceae bacterium]|nr:hypothetical protein [Mycobacteriaceae bacterium]
MRLALLITCCAAHAIVAQSGASALITSAQISPDGSAVAFVRDSGRDPSFVGVFQIDPGGQAERVVLRTSDVVSDLQWSPKGDQLGFISRTAPGAAGRLYVVSLEAGMPRAVPAPGRDVVSFVWSTDGYRVLYESIPEGNARGPRQMNIAEFVDASTAPFPSMQPLQPPDAAMGRKDGTVL